MPAWSCKPDERATSREKVCGKWKLLKPVCANVKVEEPGVVSHWLPQTFRANERRCRCLNLTFGVFFLTPTHTGKKTASIEL